MLGLCFRTGFCGFVFALTAAVAPVPSAEIAFVVLRNSGGFLLVFGYFLGE